ncbi:hypothetical protein HK405_008156 [Cladochytrium tenue]|nr:hypothetical protein HK405_008156 [Cladochytrium tenue]
MPLRQVVLTVPERRRRPLAICVCLAVAVAIIASSIAGIVLLSRQVNNSVGCWDADGILDSYVVGGGVSDQNSQDCLNVRSIADQYGFNATSGSSGSDCCVPSGKLSTGGSTYEVTCCQGMVVEVIVSSPPRPLSSIPSEFFSLTYLTTLSLKSGALFGSGLLDTVYSKATALSYLAKLRITGSETNKSLVVEDTLPDNLDRLQNLGVLLVVDLREGRRFCSALCGDASAQIECAWDCGDHGCAACFTDGAARPARPEEAAALYRSWVCLASEGADAAVAGVAGGSDGDNFEDEEEVGPDGLSLGLDWWAKEARRCRETGRLYGECVCGECEIYLEAEREAE